MGLIGSKYSTHACDAENSMQWEKTAAQATKLGRVKASLIARDFKYTLKGGGLQLGGVSFTNFPF